MTPICRFSHKVSETCKRDGTQSGNGLCVDINANLYNNAVFPRAVASQRE